MDRLEHLGYQFYLGTRNNGKHIAVKMDCATLVFGVRKHFSHGFQHTQALVPNNEFHAVQSSAFEPLKEIHPTGLVLFHTFGSTKNLSVSVLIHCDCHKNCNIFILSAPVAPQVDTVHIDVWIFAALQRAVPPVFNVDIGFLVQLTDGSRRYLAAPQGLGNILHPAHRDAGKIHLDEGFLHTAFPAAIPLDDGCLKRNALEARHMERDVSRSGGKISVIVAAAVALADLITLVAGSLSQFLSLLLQQFVQRLFHAASDQFLKLPLDYFLV